MSKPFSYSAVESVVLHFIGDELHSRHEQREKERRLDKSVNAR